jgi:hypothetical protein
MLRLPLLAALALGGCAAQTLPAVPAGHPASALTASAPMDSDGTVLAPAEQPVLPLALRRDGQRPANGMAGMDHGTMPGMDHGDMAGMPDDEGTDGPPMSAPAPAAGLTETLDAYLAIHDALAADRLADATAQAAALGSAFETLTAQPPAGDPHFWHSRADDLAAVRAQTTALGAASDLDAARAAFGAVSVAMVRLVQDLGAPAGYDLAVMTCGMAPGVPEGGVWMQRAGATANPYFGAAMPSCGSLDESVPTTDGHAGH